MSPLAGRSQTERRGRGRVRRAAAVGVAAGIVLMAGAGLVGAAPAAIVPGAIVGVDIAATASGPFEKVRIDLTFAIPASAAAGDEFHLTIPAQLIPAGPGFDVTDAAGATIASARTAGNVITFKLTRYVDAHEAVIGRAFLEAGWDRRKVSPGAAVALAFDADGVAFSDTVTVTDGLPNRARPDAWIGWADERVEDSKGPTNALRWQVASPQTTPGGPNGDVAVVVSPGAGATFSCDRVTIAESTRLDSFHEFVGLSSVVADRRTVACGPGQITVTVRNVPAATWVVVIGRATVTDGSLGEYTTAATVTTNGVTSTARGVATHSPGGGNGGGASRPAAPAGGGSVTPVPGVDGLGAVNTAYAGGAGNADEETVAAGAAAAAAAGRDGIAEGAAPAGDAANTGGTASGTATDDGIDDERLIAAGSAAGTGTVGSTDAAARTNGFQWRAVVFLGVVAAAAVVVLQRRRSA